jgi:hypothetical protein
MARPDWEQPGAALVGGLFDIPDDVASFWRVQSSPKRPSCGDSQIKQGIRATEDVVGIIGSDWDIPRACHAKSA